jgi:uncharacterized protein YycO
MTEVPAFTIRHVSLGAVDFGDEGDFFLTHRSGFASRTIGLGERLRSKTRPYAFWTHCGVFSDSSGGIVEALVSGVTADSIEKYKDIPYTILHFTIVDELVLDNMMAFVESTVGEEYNWLEIVASGINMLTGSSVSLGVDGHQICSGLVASMLLRAGAILDMSADHVTPADLARYFNVEKP